MGLAIVEMFMALEEEFGVNIPDAEASNLSTPGDVINYVCRRVVIDEAAPCPSQRAFHLLRTALMQRGQVGRREIYPDRRLSELFLGKDAKHRLIEMRKDIGARSWPRFESRLVRHSVKRVRDLVPYAATSNRVRLTRAYVAHRVKQVVVEQLGLSLSEYSESAHFVRDLGAD